MRSQTANQKKPQMLAELSFARRIYSSSGLTSSMSAYFSTQSSIGIRGNNLQLSNTLDFVHSRIEEVTATLDLTQTNSKARRAGVYLSWIYEKKDIELGGKGSIKGGWTDKEASDILERVNEYKQNKSLSGVEGAEGHHIKNAADHPADQANPNNIEPYRTHEEHIEHGHGGNPQNATDGEYIDKDQMLRNTTDNKNRILEWSNLSTVVYCAAGTGFLLGAAVTLALEGISLRSLGKAAWQGTKMAVKSTMIGIISYGAGRLIGDRVTDAAVRLLISKGVQLSPAKTACLQQGLTGVITTTFFLSVTFVRLRLKGYSTRSIISKMLPSLALSTVGAVLSLLVSHFFGKKGAIIFNFAWTGVQVIIIKGTDSHQKKVMREINYYRLEHSAPIFAEGVVV